MQRYQMSPEYSHNWESLYYEHTEILEERHSAYACNIKNTTSESLSVNHFYKVCLQYMLFVAKLVRHVVLCAPVGI
jgi:hypothetical protein